MVLTLAPKRKAAGSLPGTKKTSTSNSAKSKVLYIEQTEGNRTVIVIPDEESETEEGRNVASTVATATMSTRTAAVSVSPQKPKGRGSKKKLPVIDEKQKTITAYYLPRSKEISSKSVSTLTSPQLQKVLKQPLQKDLHALNNGTVATLEATALPSPCSSILPIGPPASPHDPHKPRFPSPEFVPTSQPDIEEPIVFDAEESPKKVLSANVECVFQSSEYKSPTQPASSPRQSSSNGGASNNASSNLFIPSPRTPPRFLSNFSHIKTPPSFLAGPSFAFQKPSAASRGVATAVHGSSRSKTKPRPRSKALIRLERKWNDKIETGTAKISIFNDYDNTTPVDDDFEYLENTRKYNPAKLLTPSVKPARLHCASCKKNRTCSSGCECVITNVHYEDEDIQKSVYDDKGLFQFDVPQGGIVVECSKRCPCDKKVCVNSVAQHPRTVPIEVFKTRDGRGWGVRPGVKVKKGTVLGIYTGDVIHRTIAECFKGNEATYVFDLDTVEDSSEEDSEHRKYSVDATNSGNWTRFINHSCSPNLKIYSAVWEHRVDMNLPNLVFVAACDISAKFELTFDYDPAQAKTESQDNDGIPVGAIRCRCKSEKCRGWVRA